MLFFKLKSSQQLILTLVFGTMLLASCSGPKKVAVAKKPRTTAEPVTQNADDADEKPPEIIADPDENTDKRSDKKGKSVDKADKVISTARTFIGTPYKYGGMTRSGMDCSGLLINSFTVVKVNLPRSSEAQSKVGQQVKMNELQPGDLVFFATGNKKNEITHVGLVTDVKAKDNVKFIHASSKLGVVETNLFAEYYQKRFRVARRVIE
ncbi:MAG TPA: C40 family peptidase [Chryseolinea sp.]|nr:C40 family peptidase [Chryseolinea sp.]